MQQCRNSQTTALAGQMPSVSRAYWLVEYLLSVRSLEWAGPKGLILAKRHSSEYTAKVPPVQISTTHSR